MSPPPPPRSPPRFVCVALAAVAVMLASCAASPPARTGTRRATRAAEERERPRAVDLSEEELFVAGLEGCQTSATADDPLVAYCPEAVFGVNSVAPGGADQLFNAWLDEVQEATGAQITVVERHQEKLFGPEVTALRLILRHPRAALEATSLVYVGLVDVRGERRRVWCSTPSHEPAGIARCQQGLVSAAHARLR